MITRWGLRGGMRLLIILRLPNLFFSVYISGFQFCRLSGAYMCVCHVSIEPWIKGPSEKKEPKVLVTSEKVCRGQNGWVLYY